MSPDSGFYNIPSNTTLAVPPDNTSSTNYIPSSFFSNDPILNDDPKTLSNSSIISNLNSFDFISPNITSEDTATNSMSTSIPNLVNNEIKQQDSLLANGSTVQMYIDSLYSKFENKSPGFAERGYQEILPYMQVDHHQVSCDRLVAEWILEFGINSIDILSTRESSTLFLKGTEFISIKLSALLLQLYRDAPGSLWRSIEQRKGTYIYQMFSFFYLFCFSCLIGALESILEKKVYYWLFLKSFAEYLTSESLLHRFELDFSHLFDKIIEQRQSRIKYIISQSLFSFKSSKISYGKSNNLHLLNEYYTLAIDGNSLFSSSKTLQTIDTWRPSSNDLLVLVDSISTKLSYSIKEKKWSSWIRLITVPMVTAALVIFSRLIRKSMFGRRIL